MEPLDLDPGALTLAGALTVRGLFPADLMAQVHVASEAIYRRRDRAAAAGEMHAGQRHAYTRQTIHLAEPGLLELEDALLRPELLALATAVLGRQSQRGDDRYVRRMGSGDTAPVLPFHQDQTIIGRELVNVWIAVTPAGQDALGLEVALGAGGALFKPIGDPGSGIPVERARLDEEEVRLAASSLHHPVLQPGDALIFLGSTPHRTHVVSGMTGTRTSIELRLL